MQRTGPVRLQDLSLLVGALGFQDHDGLRFENYANVFDPSAGGRTIPAGLQRSVRRELRAAGYQLGKGTGSLFGTKESSTARNAVSECKRLLSRLNESCGT